MTAPETTLINVESTHYPSLLLRHPGNPILTRKDWPYSINSVFNAGATLLPDGTTLLLCRIEDRRGLSHLCAARSKNGVDGWQVDAGSATRRLVGCQQDRFVAAAHRDFQRMAGALPRSPTHAFRVSISIGLGPVRPG